jgi:hypothetical protein
MKRQVINNEYFKLFIAIISQAAEKWIIKIGVYSTA